MVEVEYEALPVNVDPLQALAPDAPMIREDLKDKTEGSHGKRKHHNHIFAWQVGDKAATDAGSPKPTLRSWSLFLIRACIRVRWKPATASHRSTRSMAI